MDLLGLLGRWHRFGCHQGHGLSTPSWPWHHLGWFPISAASWIANGTETIAEKNWMQRSYCPIASKRFGFKDELSWNGTRISSSKLSVSTGHWSFISKIWHSTDHCVASRVGGSNRISVRVVGKRYGDAGVPSALCNQWGLGRSYTWRPWKWQLCIRALEYSTWSSASTWKGTSEPRGQDSLCPVGGHFIFAKFTGTPNIAT